MPDLALTTLDDLAVLDVRGTDTMAFLNGQLSHDVTLLPGRGHLLAGLHNPQGRVLALLRLFHLADDHVLIVLPAGLAGTVRQLLTKYVLRARVRLDEAGTAWQVYGITGPDAGAAASTRVHMPMDAQQWRQMIVAPRGEALPDGEPGCREAWRLEDIAAGIPEVVAATSGSFVAQMLNLDLIDAISFGKGCYTGQEVIARAHYRGQVKRRLQRFHTGSDAPLLPGGRVRLADGRAAQLVMAAPAEGGGQEFLAVTGLPPAAIATGVEAAEEDGGAGPDLLPCSQLPLPYAPGG